MEKKEQRCKTLFVKIKDKNFIETLIENGVDENRAKGFQEMMIFLESFYVKDGEWDIDKLTAKLPLQIDINKRRELVRTGKVETEGSVYVLVDGNCSMSLEDWNKISNVKD